jgi:hypothetical protein
MALALHCLPLTNEFRKYGILATENLDFLDVMETDKISG